MKLALVVVALLSAVAASGVDLEGRALEKRSGHVFTFTNNCGYSVKPTVSNTRCGYSPRCGDATDFTGSQPGTLAAQSSKKVTIPSRVRRSFSTIDIERRGLLTSCQWVGRIFNQNGNCGAKGESCTLTEYNLDTGDFYTPQAYDISNIQGFTQSIQIKSAGCDTVTCKVKSCPCSQAYPVGDTSGCGNDSPVRGCGAGDKTFTVTFCPA
ncbi:hypothetical protein BD626DRAFT_84280 [Schizophyllum amplum]|uniref:Thaumatin n=1 Tax=Schizophyllum amplum TaxID=97359 RepID=A0A550C8Z1_9AGAR|nr:hypothetical protein BD626DRAFT_84280 [Auriculariopsis ampla]